MTLRARTAAWAVGITLLGSVPAGAHAPPEASGVFWAQGEDDGERLVVRTNRGLIVSDDGGATFRLLCNEAYEVSVAEVPAMVLGQEGRFFMATVAQGLLKGTRDFCSWSRVEGPMGEAATLDVAVDPSDPQTLYLLTEPRGGAASLFRTMDGGATWSPLAPSDVIYLQVLVAPSDGARVYRIGVELGGVGEYVELLSASSDRGESWEDHPIPVQDGELQLVLLGIDPVDPDRVYVRVQATSRELPERLLVSEDAGHTVSTVLSGRELQAFAIEPGGSIVWVGGADGLHRSTDRGATFEPVTSAGLSRIRCLATRGEALFACALSGSELGVSVSSDGGETFTGLLRFTEVVEPLSCPEGTQGGSLCHEPFLDWERELAFGFRDAGALSPADTPSAPLPSPDAGAAPPPQPPRLHEPPQGTDAGSAGCGCKVAIPHTTRSSAWVALAAAAVLRSRRRARGR